MLDELKEIKGSIYTKQILELIKKSSIILIMTVFVMFGISKYVVTKLILYYDVNLINIGVTNSIDIQLAFTLITTLIIMIPVILHSIIRFLEIKNIKVTIKLWSSFILAILGLILGLTIMSKNIILGLNAEAIIQGTYDLKNILAFGMSIGLVTALSLQLILLIPLLVQFNLISVQKYNFLTAIFIIVVTFFICAWLTPTDLTSTFITMIPLNTSIFIGVKLSKTKQCEEI